MFAIRRLIKNAEEIAEDSFKFIIKSAVVNFLPQPIFNEKFLF